MAKNLYLYDEFISQAHKRTSAQALMLNALLFFSFLPIFSFAQTTLVKGDVVRIPDGAGINNVQIQVVRPNVLPLGTIPSTSTGGINQTFLTAFTPGNYNIRPNKTNNYVYGVTTLDLVLASRHILATQPITSPIKLMCADVNGDENVSTADVVIMRTLILAITNNLGLDAQGYLRPSWLFWNDNAINYNSIQSLRTNLANAFGPGGNLTGFNINATTPAMLQNIVIAGEKLGDIGGTPAINPNIALVGNNKNDNFLPTSSVRSADTPIINANAEEVVSIDVKLNNVKDCIAWQTGLSWDKDAFEIVNVEGLDKDFYNLAIEGAFTALNYSSDNSPCSSNCVRLNLKAKKDIADLYSAIVFSNEKTMNLAYEMDKEIENPFRFDINVLHNNAKVFPNPFVNSLTIELPKDVTTANVAISDILGRSVMSKSISQSNNTIDDLSGLEKGIYTIFINLGNGKKVQQKLIKQ